MKKNLGNTKLRSQELEAQVLVRIKFHLEQEVRVDLMEEAEDIKGFADNGQ